MRGARTWRKSRKLPHYAVAAALLLGSGAASAETAAKVDVPQTAVQLDAETKCLALAVYWEGRAESETGRLAIAHTVLNRVRSGEFPDTICGVVSQKSDNGKSCQFSWWCDGKQDRPQDDETWDQSISAAREAMQADSKDPTGGALFFHSARISPNWDGQRQRLISIGNHVFYR